MRCTLPVLLATLMLALPVIANAQVYKWKDAGGTEHFSDSPPPQGTKYSTLKTRANADQSMTKPKADDHGEENTSETPKADQAHASKLKKFCSQLHSNIAMLESRQPLNQVDKQGKRVQMSAAARAQQLKLQQQRYQAYCEK
jgi:hypothetical protein